MDCTVNVFLLRVDRLLKRWPEKKERKRLWFTLAQAAMAVEEGDLVILLLRLAAPTSPTEPRLSFRPQAARRS